MPNCYYYDEQRNHCKCYINENLDELLTENAKLRDELDAAKHDLSLFSERIVELGAENAKLREERDHWHVEQVHAYGNWEDAHKRATELAAENSELRKLVRDIYDEYRYLRMRFHRTYVQHEERMRVIEQRMRKLGADVDDDREA